MRRRTVLTGTVLGAISGPGCLSALESECPSQNIENGVSYESRDPTGELFLNPNKEGVFSITSTGEANRFDAHSFDREDRRWVRDTDFEDAIVLGIQIRASEEAGPLQVRGAGRESAETIHVYTCIERAGETRHWTPYTRLLRVPYDGDVPHTAKLTRWGDGDDHTFVESCAIACFDFTHIGWRMRSIHRIQTSCRRVYRSAGERSQTLVHPSSALDLRCLQCSPDVGWSTP